MKFCFLLFFIVLSSMLSVEAQENAGKATKIDLIDGDSITGTVSGTRDGSVSVITDYGVIRVPIAKLTPESRKALGISGDVSVAELQKKVSDLEDMVQRLRAENAELRKQQASGSTGRISPVAGSGAERATPSAAAGGSFWMSSTGKRHNSRCRYYGTGKGRSCGGSEGIACKICGG